MVDISILNGVINQRSHHWGGTTLYTLSTSSDQHSKKALADVQNSGRTCIYIYNHYPTLLAGAYPNVRYIIQGVFGGGLEHVSVRFEGIWTTFPTKTTPGGRSATNFTFEWGPKKCTFWHGPPEK